MTDYLIIINNNELNIIPKSVLEGYKMDKMDNGQNGRFYSFFRTRKMDNPEKHVFA
jgi:hypothetical protein